MIAQIEKCHICGEEYKLESPLYKCQACNKYVCNDCKIVIDNEYHCVCSKNCENNIKKV